LSGRNKDAEEAVEERVLLREGILTEAHGDDGKPRLIASCCRRCGDVAFPRKFLCGKCEGAELDEVMLGPRGTVHTYTVVRVAPPGYHVPYPLAMVKFAEDEELTVLGQLNCPPDQVKMGMEVELHFGPIYVNRSGSEVMCYGFKPVD